MEFQQNTFNLALGLTASIISLGWAVRAFLRRISRDNNEIAKDRAEINIIDTLQSQIATLSAENLRLRNNEAELSVRIGRLETKEKEVENHVIMINKLQKKLDEKDNRIEELFSTYTEETTRLRILLEIKDKEISKLSEKIAEMEIKYFKGNT